MTEIDFGESVRRACGSDESAEGFAKLSSAISNVLGGDAFGFLAAILMRVGAINHEFVMGKMAESEAEKKEEVKEVTW